MSEVRRNIEAYPARAKHDACSCCGKNKSKRQDKNPAPIHLVIGQRLMLSLCMACAKKISDRLDRAIQRVENGYVVRKDVCRKTQGKAEPGNSCLTTPGTCESCPDWTKAHTGRANG